MGQLVAQKDKQLLGKIMKLHCLFSSNEDLEASEKVKELGRKTLEREFAIAFCGHFSAGKSSMINSLIGEDILPSSPIPTSANLVKIKSGEAYARVFFKEGKTRLYPAPYDYEAVKSYCKDGDQIQSLEISHKGTGLLNDVVVMDTPGIDSADDAHRIATESALHLADLVLYVMDYNHVQSELNFLFTRELTDAGKELYLVVNMIDKHREEELLFEDFKKSVYDSFAAWGVKPKGIFFTSLKKPEMTHNQFPELQQFLQDRISTREELLPESVFKSLIKVSEDHVKQLQDTSEEQISTLTERLQDVPEAEWDQLSEEQLRVKARIKELEKQESLVHTGFIDGMDEILKNAYLMPFKTRELAESYLKSMQPDFKVGLFFAKQKTIQERAERLDLFYKDLAEKVGTQLDWHLKEFLLTSLKNQGIQDSRLLTMAQSFKVEFSKDLLEETINTGAGLSGDYVLKYTNDVAERLKKLAREQLREFKDLYLEAVKLLSKHEMVELVKAEQKVKQLVDTYDRLKAVRESLSSKKEQVFEVLYGDIQTTLHLEEATSLFIPQIDEEVVKHDVRTVLENTTETQESSAVIPNIKQVDKGNLKNHHLEVKRLVEKLRVTGNAVENLPGLKRISKELVEKASRLENQQFTVALFGAFSAGKSSFANALIGENLLPVSPNPTTAAINKIKPIDEEHPHGTVLVKVKDASQLLEEINRSLKLFHLEATDFSQAIEKITSIQTSKENTGAAEKLHHSFLRAFAAGYKLFEGRMGNTFNTDLESFRGYVADEEKSCFVEWIEVFYDCPLTREGISLVDTPGADSINARHTGVAFDYIKNSDAILFVTYYNHAFSKADREFLIQLGRVKDTFELDKMFFIVNAIDLANSEAEMEDVLAYVEGQLVQYGIRQPHLYPISSLLALKEKTENKLGHSRFGEFEQSFYSFISEDLMKMAMDSAEAKWKQSVLTLEKLLQSAKEGKEEKEEKLNALEQERVAVNSHIGNKDADILQKQLIQEANELVYYTNQRVFLRFSDFFRESFNPSVLKDDGRDLKQALQMALDELLESIGYDLLQEMRATTLRVESFIMKILDEFQEQLSKELQQFSADLILSKVDGREFVEIDFETAFKDLDKKKFRKALALFKNPKSFFEKDEKRVMREELEKLLQPPAEEYLQKQGKSLKDHYVNAFAKQLEYIRKDCIDQAEEYYTGVKSTLSTDFPIEELNETYNIVKSLS